MMIAGLDLASRITGFCVGDGSALPQADVWEFEQVGEDYGWLQEMLDDYLSILFDRWSPDLIAIERPLLINKASKRGFGDKITTLRKLYPMASHVHFRARKAGIRSREYTVQSVKKELTGKAMATKDDMVLVANRVGLKLPKVGAEDAADAFALFLCGLREADKTASARFDSLIWSRGRSTLI